MEAKQFDKIITREFLEKILNKKVEKFIVTSGSNPGDNYSSTMYSIEVHLSGVDENGNPPDEKNAMYLIAKCYPDDPSRQKFLIDSNSTYKELSFYKVFVPELVKMQKELGLKEIAIPAFPPLIGGEAINFDEVQAEPGKIYKPFDNYILMIDLRKSYGFRLFNRMTTFDRAHLSLVIEAMAKNHALSWAYKQKNNIRDITSKYPFIINDFSIKEMESIWKDFMKKNGASGCQIIKNYLGESASYSPVFKGLEKFVGSLGEILEITFGVGRDHKEYDKHMRIPLEPSNNELPWKVVIQGDCWCTNMLFRYNETSGEPEEVILLDLQIVREQCPTTDLANSIYTSTDSKFRKEHLDDMLKLYYEQFIYYCKMMQVDPLPGFSLNELKRRFHRSKFYGYAIALGGLPVMLAENVDIKDIETLKEGETIADMVSRLCSPGQVNKDGILSRRLADTAQDMYDEGII